MLDIPVATATIFFSKKTWAHFLRALRRNPRTWQWNIFKNDDFHGKIDTVYKLLQTGDISLPRLRSLTDDT